VEEQEQVEMEDAAADALAAANAAELPPPPAGNSGTAALHEHIDTALNFVETARTAKVVRVSGEAAFAAANAACTAWAASQAQHRLQEVWGASAHCEHAAAAVWAKYAVGKLNAQPLTITSSALQGVEAAHAASTTAIAAELAAHRRCMDMALLEAATAGNIAMDARNAAATAAREAVVALNEVQMARRSSTTRRKAEEDSQSAWRRALRPKAAAARPHPPQHPPTEAEVQEQRDYQFAWLLQSSAAEESLADGSEADAPGAGRSSSSHCRH
jgi:hypothetical protein